MDTPHAHLITTASELALNQAANRLAEWYLQNKRNLPWRGAEAYGVWVSEIMLQQTQVATVIPYYLRFMDRFPTVLALAEAPLDDVLQRWAGLGYYARARNLHRAANLIVTEHGGILPDSIEKVRALPGIGEYTAGAILSIAYNRRYAAIDANVIRVICRLFGIQGDPKSAQVQQTIREAALALVPEFMPGDHNQAVMELGALICSPADPGCDNCPLLYCCSAGNSSDPTALPEIAPGKSTTSLTHACIILHNEADNVYIVRRPPHGLWGGLWEFPRVVCAAGEQPAAAAGRAAAEIVGIEVAQQKKLITLKHAVTRFRITLHAYSAELPVTQTSHEAPTAGLWVSLSEIESYAFSSPQAQVRSALLGASAPSPADGKLRDSP